jgi:hypothetical protein
MLLNQVSVRQYDLSNTDRVESITDNKMTTFNDLYIYTQYVQMLQQITSLTQKI